METKLCLNGYWDFLPLKADEDFRTADSERWIGGRYLVPSSWRSTREMYDIFSYPKEWDDYKRGAVRRTVCVDYEAGKHVFLRLDAISQQAFVYVNGCEAAHITDMFLPAEVELTGFLAAGHNELEITVLCDTCPTVTRADGEVKNLVPAASWYSGICRGLWQDAWLITRGEAWIERCFALTLWRDKTLSVSVDTRNAQDCTVTGVVLDAAGEAVLALDESLAASWPDPHPWMPDDPYLYTLRLSLLRNGELLDVFEQRFGFREVRVDGPELYINDVHIHLRADSWHFQGLAMQRKAYAENWYRMAKEQGINFIRPHTFPYPQCFYDAADECGMLIMAESGIYGSGKAMQADDPRFIQACREHLTQFVRDYRNHPSIIVWSMQNEMRWVDGREGYKACLTELMDIMAAEDPSRRLISCDGDNRLLTPEMMQAVSMHYNIDGRIADWDRTRPLLFGEHGAFHYVSPQVSADFAGADSYLGFWDAMRGIAENEALFLRCARREGVTGVTPFNYGYYMTKAMPFEDIPLDPGDVTAPGPHPNVFKAYALNINNGQIEGYPPYLPQSAMRAVQRETAAIAVLPEESDTRFFAGGKVTRNFVVYNDTYRARDVSVTCIAEMNEGRILFAREQAFRAEAGSRETLRYTFDLPRAEEPASLTLRFTVRHDGDVVLEDSFDYRVMPPLPAFEAGGRVVCFGKAGSVPACAARTVEYVSSIEELSRVSADLLIVGEDQPFTQETLQPVLRALTESRRVRAVLILAQETFAVGRLTLSKRAFFAAYATGSHPVTDGLTRDDLRFWNAGNIHESEEGWMIANAFDKPTDKGWRVLLECAQGDWGWGGMQWCALVEGEENGVPVLACQLRLGDHLAKNPAAEWLYAGAVRYLLNKKPAAERPVLRVTPNELDRAEAVLKQGGAVLVSACTDKDAPALSRLLGRTVEIFPAETYGVRHVPCPLTNGISDTDITGLERVTYSAPSLVNRPAAAFALKADGVQTLFTNVIAPWKTMFVDGQEYEGVKIACATRYDREEHETFCYGFAAQVGEGTLIVSQLADEGRSGFVRAADVLAMNAGEAVHTDIFTVIKEPEQHFMTQIMTLKVLPSWDYDEAVRYHADPAFLLNNLGEGSFGWMRRVNAVNGLMTVPDSANTGVFATVFADCALNHDPENRQAGEIPDPSIVPDLTVVCNTAFRVYVNGKRFEGLSDVPDAPVSVTIEDVLLEKGLNRIFFELLPAPHDIVLGAVFRDKLGAYLDDTKYRMTID